MFVLNLSSALREGLFRPGPAAAFAASEGRLCILLQRLEVAQPRLPRQATPRVSPSQPHPLPCHPAPVAAAAAIPGCSRGAYAGGHGRGGTGLGTEKAPGLVSSWSRKATRERSMGWSEAASDSRWDQWPGLQVLPVAVNLACWAGTSCAIG